MWGAIIGAAIKIGITIWNNSQGRHPGGLAIDMAKLVEWYGRWVLGDVTSTDFKKINPDNYEPAVDFFQSALGVSIYDCQDIVRLNDGNIQDYLNHRYGDQLHQLPLSEAPSQQQLQYAVKVMQYCTKNADRLGKWDFAGAVDAVLPYFSGMTLAGYKMTQDQIVANPKAAAQLVSASTLASSTLQTPSLASSLTGTTPATTTLSTPDNPQVLQEVVVTAKKKSALEQYWYIFAIPLLPLAILLYRYFSKKRRR
jgi:hypothetical protein